MVFAFVGVDGLIAASAPEVQVGTQTVLCEAIDGEPWKVGNETAETALDGLLQVSTWPRRQFVGGLLHIGHPMPTGMQ